MFTRRHKRGLIARSLLTLACTLGLSVYTLSQTTTAVLKGVVTDEARAIILGAQLTLTGERGDKHKTTSSDHGEFSFGELPVGTYKLTVIKEGFAEVNRTIDLVATMQSTDMTLRTETISENVTVVMDSAEAAVESTLKSGESIHQTPRSITAVGSERIREQNFRQVADILNYVPGTTQNSYRNGSYHFYARGYRMGPEDTRLDGFAGINVGSGGFGASMFGIEEAVVLRGPASLLYGQTGSPGGLINLVTKRPQENYFTRIDIRTGGYSGNGVSLFERPMYAGDIDSTGSLTKNGRILYRGLATFENMNYFTRGTLDRNRYLNGSLTFKLDRDGQYLLTPSAQYTRYFRPYGGGIVVSPSSSLSAGLNPASDPFNAPINTNDLSSLDINLFGGRRIEETKWYGFEFRGVPTHRLRVNTAYRFVSFDTDINSFTPVATTRDQIEALRDQFVISRVQAKSLTERNYHNFNADVSYEWLSTPRWRNTTQGGFYTRVLNSRATRPQGAIPGPQSPINVYTGMASSSLADTFPGIAFDPWGRDTIYNGFVQNRSSLANGKVIFAIGANYGWQEPNGGSTRKSGIIPNASVVFNANSELAVYASYSTSFNPVDPTLEDINGRIGTFDPTMGKSYEIGAKYDLLNRRIGIAFSLFHNQIDGALVQSDIGVLNTNNNRYYIPAGTRRSRGAEFTGQFQIRHDLSLTGGVSYTSAIYKGFPAEAPSGSSPIPYSWAEKTPHFSYNFYSRWDRREGKLNGFGAGLGVIWQGKRIGSNGARTYGNPDPLVLPSFTRVDSALFYRLNKFVNFALNVENMLDEVIYVNASVGSNIEIAAPRTMTLRTSFNF